MSILIENVTKHFGKNIVLDGINLEIKTGSLVALLGGSGSGKSTLLRVVAGFEEPTTGRVWLNGKDSNILSIQEKEIGFVFQAYALFQHLTVYENIAFGLSCNNSFFDLGFSTSPVISYFSRCSSFIFSLFSFCQHTLQKSIQYKKYTSNFFFADFLHHTPVDRKSLLDQGSHGYEKHFTGFKKAQPPISNLEQKGWSKANLKTKNFSISSNANTFNIKNREENLVNKEKLIITAKKKNQPVTDQKFGVTAKPTYGSQSLGHVNENNSLSSGNLRSVEELLRLVGLEELAHRYPNQLSGGQCQRVALARALAVQPKVLLLDEPFGALDTKVRKNLRRWLRQLHERVGVTTLFVTHDHQEAMEVANEIVVLEKGRVKHSLNSPHKIFSRLTKISPI